jgi:hypothetical protein
MEGLCTQVLNRGNASHCIRVIEEQTAVNPPAENLLAQIQAFDWREEQRGGVPNARMISPWLMRTMWHEHLEPHRVHEAELRTLVAMPKDDELPWLHELVYQYFSSATGLIDDTDELVLQILNSADPEKK